MKRLPTPRVDLALFTDHLSQAWGVGWGFPAAQYVVWSSLAGIFSILAGRKGADAHEISSMTILNDDGVDALLPVLMALGLVAQSSGTYNLTTLGEEYFVPESVYYIGPGLSRNHDVPIPRAYVKVKSEEVPAARPQMAGDATQYFKSQVSRNLAAGVQAVRSGCFNGITHLVDIGGGAGSLSIPFAQDYSSAKITLVDLPESVGPISDVLASYSVAERIRIVAMDVFQDPWEFPGVDAVLFGNFFHIFNDAQCRDLSIRCFEALPHGGKVLVHELPFDDDRGGPMVAALWNANMRIMGGRQRTSQELFTILQQAGFLTFESIPTASKFHLFHGTKS